MGIKGNKIKKRYLLLIFILILGAFALWRTLNAPVPNYQTLIVRPGDLQQSVLATGKLDALRKVDVGAQVSGQLKTLSVAIGDKVKKDQLLGVIDPEQAENQIKEVEATLMELRAQRQQAEAEWKLARVTLARQQQLAKTQAVSQQDLDTAATEMNVRVEGFHPPVQDFREVDFKESHLSLLVLFFLILVISFTLNSLSISKSSYLNMDIKRLFAIVKMILLKRENTLKCLKPTKLMA